MPFLNCRCRLQWSRNDHRLVLVGRPSKTRSHATENRKLAFLILNHEKQAPYFGQGESHSLLCNTRQVCRCCIKFGNNSRCLRDLFPNLPGLISLFDRARSRHVISFKKCDRWPRYDPRTDDRRAANQNYNPETASQAWCPEHITSPGGNVRMDEAHGNRCGLARAR